MSREVIIQKPTDFLELSDKEQLELLQEIAEKISKKAKRTCIGIGWEYNPIDHSITIKFRFRHFYIELPKYESLIEALKEICEEYGFPEERCFITFEQSSLTLEGYVDVSIELEGDEDES